MKVSDVLLVEGKMTDEQREWMLVRGLVEFGNPELVLKKLEQMDPTGGEWEVLRVLRRCLLNRDFKIGSVDVGEVREVFSKFISRYGIGGLNSVGYKKMKDMVAMGGVEGEKTGNGVVMEDRVLVRMREAMISNKRDKDSENFMLGLLKEWEKYKRKFGI